VRRIDFTARSRADLKNALAHSRETFGLTIHRRYSRLIDQALSDLAADPNRPGVRKTAPDLFTYHLRSSNRRTPRADRITRPRHIIVFRADGERLLIIRVLDDRMDISAQLP
jgi:plasmid stabilization system protein ParE